MGSVSSGRAVCSEELLVTWSFSKLCSPLTHRVTAFTNYPGWNPNEGDGLLFLSTRNQIESALFVLLELSEYPI